MGLLETSDSIQYAESLMSRILSVPFNFEVPSSMAKSLLMQVENV